MDTIGHFKSIDHLTLFYRAWFPANPRAVIILIHGAGEHSGRYEYIGECCMDHNITLVAPDLRGFGQSEGHRGHINRFSDYLDDLKVLINTVSKRYPSIPVFLFGHSLGGLVAIRYGQTYPQQVKGFILSSPALGLRFPIPSAIKRTLNFISRINPELTIQPFKWAEILRKARHLKPYLPEPGSDIVKDPFHTTQYTPRWLTELIQNGIHATMEASKFQVPLLCLYDKEDPIIHPNSIKQFLDSVTIPEKDHVIFSEGHHHPWHAPHQQQALDSMITWLNTRI
ncbi:alpha/beta hydrolase [Oceanobacillus salinisoli]|uniref:alpha/beta hydrolase n=1 Tax=Oceanobacillus salinisoli TaxID=2678611 RepID=UPI0012E2AF1B|nr:alpha/beta hydrolase [Oceanobacillus salinisoli]